MEDLVYLGKYIKLQRERRNLNISQLAYKCNFSRSYLSQIESGRVIPSEKLNNTIDAIFTCLNLNYQNYLEKGLCLQQDVDDLLHYIFYNLQEQRDALYSKMRNEEEDYKSYKAFPRYCLSKFVYNVSMNNQTDSELDYLMKSLLDNINIFEIKDRSICYTFVGIYYRQKSNCDKSESFLLESLKFGEFKDITGITYYQLSITQSLKNSVAIALLNIQKSILRFKCDGNFKCIIYSQAQEAIILGRCGELERAEKVLKEILNNYQLNENFKKTLLINLAQSNISLKKYEEALHILDEINIVNDNVIFMRLYVYYELSNKKDFNEYYESNINNIKTILFKQQTKILHMKINNEKQNEEYLHLLLETHSNDNLKYDVDLRVFVLDELIEYYEEIGKYKLSNKYLKEKIKLYEA